MKFDHIVKFNGVLYPSGTDVPIEPNENTKSAMPTVEEPMVGVVVSEESEVKEEETTNSSYSKEDINKLSYPQMKKFAKELGLKSSPKMSSDELKAMIFEKLSL